MESHCICLPAFQLSSPLLSHQPQTETWHAFIHSVCCVWSWAKSLSKACRPISKGRWQRLCRNHPLFSQMVVVGKRVAAGAAARRRGKTCHMSNGLSHPLFSLVSLMPKLVTFTRSAWLYTQPSPLLCISVHLSANYQCSLISAQQNLFFNTQMKTGWWWLISPEWLHLSVCLWHFSYIKARLCCLSNVKKDTADDALMLSFVSEG